MLFCSLTALAHTHIIKQHKWDCISNTFSVNLCRTAAINCRYTAWLRPQIFILCSVSSQKSPASFNKEFFHIC